jgi:hypothetical protein
VATVVRELRAGAIIVFHDGGGDRSQTVAALPQVLRQLHARGYRAVALPAGAAAPAKRLGSKRQAGPIPAARVENVML